jgi:drug/metabolite transporter (DMT)-like permease
MSASRPGANSSGAIGLALLSAALFGASTPAAKVLLGGLGPWLLAGLLYLGSGVGLASVLIARKLLRIAVDEAPIRAPDLPWLAGAVLFGGLMGPALLFMGLDQTKASSAALLLNLEGLATMAIAWVVFRESVDRRLLAGAAAILAGALVLAWNGGAVGAAAPGALFILGACIAWGLDNNLTRKISGADPLQIAAAKGLVAGAVNFGIGLRLGAVAPPVKVLLVAGGVGFLGYGVSLICFILALRRLGTARTGAYFSTAPFVGALLAVVALGERATVWLALSGGLMAVGVWLHLSERHAHRHTHELLEHEHAHSHDEHHQHSHTAVDPRGQPHSHCHVHGPLVHAHAHFPDLHHRHRHG